MHATRPFHILSVTLIVSSLLVLPGKATHLPTPLQAGTLAQPGILSWNTFLGGNELDDAIGIALDADGNAYVAGRSDTTWGSPVRPFAGGGDAFVAKLDGTGALIWNAFLGGSAGDNALAIAVDANDDVYVAGLSYTTWGNPVNPFVGVSDYLGDAYVAKLNSNGTLLWNTFLGGSGSDQAWGIAVDGSGNVRVTGTSGLSWGKPVNPFAGNEDAFVASLDTNGNLLWNTFLGSYYSDSGQNIALDASGNSYVAGMSTATWGHPVIPFVGGQDAFVAKLDSSGALTWNTFLPDDAGGLASIALDGAGNAYVTGDTGTTWGNPVNPFTNGPDAYVAKLDGSGALTWNTFLAGGSSPYSGFSDIALDANANAYVLGGSYAPWGTPVRPYSGLTDAWVARVTNSGALEWNTFLGGAGNDGPGGIALDGHGNIYTVGGSDFTWGYALRSWSGGPDDGFVARLDTVPPDAFGKSSPANGATNQPVTSLLKWTASTDAIGYVYCIDTVNDGQCNTLTWVGNVTSVAQPNLLPGKKYYWQVWAFNAAGATPADGAAWWSFATAPATTLTLYSTGGSDGWVLESAPTSGLGGKLNATGSGLLLGDDALNRQYRSILSFSTGGLPDNAVILSVTLKIRKAGGSTANLFNLLGNIVGDIKSGTFGSGVLEPPDFQTGPTKPGVLAFTSCSNTNWCTSSIAKAYFGTINKTGPTQFRLRFAKDSNNNNAADNWYFYSGDTLTMSNRPQLVIQYYVP